MARLEDVMRQAVSITPVAPAASPIGPPPYKGIAPGTWNYPGVTQAALYHDRARLNAIPDGSPNTSGPHTPNGVLGEDGMMTTQITVPPVPYVPPPSGGNLLTEPGDRFLLEDGTSILLLE